MHHDQKMSNWVSPTRQLASIELPVIMHNGHI